MDDFFLGQKNCLFKRYLYFLLSFACFKPLCATEKKTSKGDYFSFWQSERKKLLQVLEKEDGQALLALLATKDFKDFKPYKLLKNKETLLTDLIKQKEGVRKLGKSTASELAFILARDQKLRTLANKQGETALYLVLKHKKLSLLQSLLTQSSAAEINSLEHPRSLLILALETKQVEAAKALILAGCDFMQSFHFSVPTGQQSVLQGNPFYWAICWQEVELLAVLIKHPHFQVDKVRLSQKTNFLSLALPRKNKKLIHLLLKFLPQTEKDRFDERQNLPLNYALTTSQPELVSQLLPSKQKLLDQKNYQGKTALSLAYKHEDWKSFWFLIAKGASLSQRSVFYQDQYLSPLFAAIRQKKIALALQILREPKFSLSHEKTLHLSHLLEATKTQNKELVQELLQKGFNQEASDEKNENALFRAYRQKNLDLFKLLLARGLSSTQKNNRGHSLESELIVREDKVFLELLLEKEMNFNEKYFFSNSFCQEEQAPCTALYHAMLSHQDWLIEKIINSTKHDLSTLHSKRAQTYLELALLQGKLSWVRLLLAKGAKFSELLSRNKNPLSLAAQSGNKELILFLAAEHSFFSRADDKGFYPLDYLVEKADISLLKELFKQGACLKKISQGVFNKLLQAGKFEVFKILWEQALKEKLFYNETSFQVVERLACFALDFNRLDFLVLIAKTFLTFYGEKKQQISAFLFKALTCRNPELLASLLGIGFDDSLPNQNGETLVSRALQNDQRAQLEVLLKNSQTLNKKARFLKPNHALKAGKMLSPLVWTLKYKQELALFLLRSPRVHFEVPEDQDLTEILFTAASSGATDLLKELEKRKVSFTVLNKKGQNLLMCAAIHQRYELLLFLLKQEIYALDEQDNSGKTVFELVKKKSLCFYYLKFLELRQEDFFQEQMLKLAQSKKALESIKLLEELMKKAVFLKERQLSYFFDDFFQEIFASYEDLDEFFFLRDYLKSFDEPLSAVAEKFLQKIANKLILSSHEKRLLLFEKDHGSLLLEKKEQFTATKEKTCCVCHLSMEEEEEEKEEEKEEEEKEEEKEEEEKEEEEQCLGPAACACFVCEDCVPRLCQFELEQNGSEISQCPGCNKLFSPDFLARGIQDEQKILKFRENTCKKRLAKLPDWYFCPRADCLNGKVVATGESFFFSCQLCSLMACIRCGQDHSRGECQQFAEQLKHLENLLQEGKKAPPTNGHPRNPDHPDYLKGRFRPCYWCGALTEKEADGTSNDGQCNSMICKNPRCRKKWHFNYGDHRFHPAYYSGNQVIHDFNRSEQKYEPHQDPHF